MEDSIVESVIDQYKQRSEIGFVKYKMTLDRDDLTTLEWLKHLQEELMDATLYIEKLKTKLQMIKSDEV
jgi:tRNA A37 threonylcarbamoyladenosine biosynthesis protein TsaE